MVRTAGPGIPAGITGHDRPAGSSAGVRVSGSDESLGQWALDVIDAAELQAPAAIGVSYGAGILLRLAELAPERVSRAALVVPSGMVGSPMPAMLRLAASYGLYRLRPSRARAASVTAMLAHGPADDLMVESVERSFGGTKLETEMPRLARPGDLASFRSPVLVVAAEHDPLFPPARVLPAARTLFPNPVSADRAARVRPHHVARCRDAPVSQAGRSFLSGLVRRRPGGSETGGSPMALAGIEGRQQATRVENDHRSPKPARSSSARSARSGCPLSNSGSRAPRSDAFRSPARPPLGSGPLRSAPSTAPRDAARASAHRAGRPLSSPCQPRYRHRVA